jgi:hypothetical protein
MTVMRPVNIQAIIDNEVISFSWNQNPRGVKPVAYDVYASNESHGFSPETQNWIKRVGEPRMTVPLYFEATPYTFYRIVAISPNGEKSGPSDAFALPFPRVLTRVSPIWANDTCRIVLKSNKLFYPNWNNYYDTIYSKVTIDVVQKPVWLNFDSLTSTLSGSLDSQGLSDFTLDTLLNTIVLDLKDSGKPAIRQTIRLRAATTEDIASGMYSFKGINGNANVAMEKNVTPTDFSILPGFPNPFNGATMVRIGLPEECRVSIRILNLKGQLVECLADGIAKPGFINRSWHPTNVASGVYCLIVTVDPITGSNGGRRKVVNRLAFMR